MAQSTTSPRGARPGGLRGPQPRWLRATGIGLGVLAATAATIGLIYLGVDALLGRDDIPERQAAQAEPAADGARSRFPEREPSAATLPGAEPTAPPLVEPAPMRREPPTPPPVREPEPPRRPAPQPAPPRSRAAPVPSRRAEPPVEAPLSTPPRELGATAPEPSTEPVDLLVRVVDPENAVLGGVALSLTPGAQQRETNERGEWVFERLVPGAYQITATLEDYFPIDVTVEVGAGRGEEAARAEVLTLRPTNRAAREEQAKIDIAAMFEDYGKAYMDLDPDALLEVYPTAKIESIREHFQGVKSYEAYTFTPPEFTALDVDEGTATVDVTLQRKFEPRVGRPQEPDDQDFEFSLVKPAEVGRWLVSGFTLRRK